MSVRYVLFVATNAAVIGPNKRPTGFFFPEIAHPFEALDKAGIAVEFASPLGGKPPEDGFDGEDPAQTAFLNSKAYRRLSRSRKLSEVDVLDYDAVFFPADSAQWSTSPGTQRCRQRSFEPGTQAGSSPPSATVLLHFWASPTTAECRWCGVAS